MRMKRLYQALPVIAAVAGIVPMQQAQAQDSCKIFLCMAGRAQGHNPIQGCSDSVRTYFSIRLYDSEGQFLRNLTKESRTATWIDACPSAGSDQTNKQWAQKIKNKYGPMEWDDGS